MGKRKSSNTSTRRDSSVATNPVDGFTHAIRELAASVQTAKKHGFRLPSHSHYGPKAQAQLIEARKTFLILKGAYPETRYPAVKAQLDKIEPLVEQLRSNLDGPAELLGTPIREILQRLGSDLAAELAGLAAGRSGDVPLIPTDIVKAGVYRKILDEANRCFASSCHNASAAMLRRLIESLIIEAFEAHGVEARIKGPDGEYQELKALIGKASAEQSLRLTRNTRNALPNLKMLGDLSLHSRRHLVREDDLGRIRNDARVAIEELASHSTA